MPKLVETPEGLRPFVFHGMSFDPPVSGQARAKCPFCAKQKFFANVQNGLWDCKVCGKSGNPKRLIQQLWEEGTAPDEEFAANRSLQHLSSLVEIGIRHSTISGEVMVPAYGDDGEISNVYLYLKDYKTNNGKKILYPTSGIRAGLFGLGTFQKNKKKLYIVEGPWKVAVLNEVLSRSKLGTDGEVTPTGNVKISLQSDANVIGVPGCGTWHESWNSITADKDVLICFDSDHPKEVDGKTYPPGGWSSAKRLFSKLIATTPPSSIQVLRWGIDGFDPDITSGYDIRDRIGEESTAQGRSHALGEILSKVEPAPEEWVNDGPSSSGSRSESRLEIIECTSWKELTNQWRKAMKWSEGLERALSIMLASAMSTQMPGDQLWVRIISPPSTGKTQLCDAIGTNYKQVKSVGNFTGLHSGFQTDRNAEEDHSMLAQIKGMTLVVKDGDTLLKNPNREKILGQVRDAYDMNCAVSYGNKVKREYINHRFTFVLAGTEALMEMDSADLGARFLDCVIMNKIDSELEVDINCRGFYRIVGNRGKSADNTSASQDDDKMLRAKAMTGGYLKYLRDNADVLLGLLDTSDISHVQDRISNAAQFVAYARARPSKSQVEAMTREMSPRLNNQLTKLALCLPVIWQRKTMDGDVLNMVSQTAMDTARGRTLDILLLLLETHQSGTDGLEAQSISGRTHYGLEKTRALLRFLRSIGALETHEPMEGVGMMRKVGRTRWRLTPALVGILESVELDSNAV